ncbi:aminoacyl-tRNA synthetase, partial [Trifolium medium]|nr:aminoacyl-tRNA synthetase [Trifolium medium]
SSSSEGDEEYQWDDDNVEEEEEEEEEDEDSASMSEDSDKPRKVKRLPGRTRRETKLSEESDSIEDEDQTMKVEEPVSVPYPVVEEENEDQKMKVEEPVSPPGQDEVEGTGKRRFLDLNELAPSPGFDDGPNTIVKDED